MKLLRLSSAIFTASVIALLAVSKIQADDQPFIIVQSTTSTQNSGLLDSILPLFTRRTGIEVRVVAVGTGQAIKNATNGDGDVLLVHSKAAEEQFVSDGWGFERFDVMYNDFIIVGPPEDPANIMGQEDATDALQAIAHSRSIFASRGDDSGTHKAELKLWDEAQIDAQSASGRWYRETGSGMGSTLNVGVGMRAYVLTDRATWIAFGNKGDYKIAVQSDKRLFNQYGVILVNNQKHPNVKEAEGQMFIDWLLGDEGQEAITAFEIDDQQLFFPNAKNRSE